jgi:hypothetical protein
LIRNTRREFKFREDVMSDGVRVQAVLTKKEAATLLLVCDYAVCDALATNDSELVNRFTWASTRLIERAAQPGELITIDLEMTRIDYHYLLLMAGYGAKGAERRAGIKARWQAIHVVNQLFAAMPNFGQFEIPNEYRWHELQ